jgi:hypothetical protein
MYLTCEKVVLFLVASLAMLLFIYPDQDSQACLAFAATKPAIPIDRKHSLGS